MLAVLLLAMAAVTAPSPPYPARLVVDAAFIRRSAEERAPIIGLLRRDDEVMVVGCSPLDCNQPGARALLEGGGVIRAALLRPRSAGDPPVPVAYDYGRVRGGGARVRAEPNEQARILERRRAGQDLAFVPDAALRATGWLRRIYGGFVRVEDVRLATASSFRGEPEPTLPLAFVLREGGGHQRYDRSAVVAVDGRLVRLADGAAPRAHVRIARARSRPEAIPAAARWVHVSLAEQVLVAYEGDRAVFATLISSGLETHPTPAGLYHVYDKEIHAPMHGDPPEPYFVDEVPFVQYFLRGLALHGTFWHDRFGWRASHGCVNLSMADARWLFAWAPPRLPAGWHSIEPEPAGLPMLWVLITR